MRLSFSILIEERNLSFLIITGEVCCFILCFFNLKMLIKLNIKNRNKMLFFRVNRIFTFAQQIKDFENS